MNFLAPLMLLGLLAAAGPVIAHLLGRRRPRRIALATMRFLEPREPVVARRRTIHDWPLFVVRVLLLVFIVLAVAKPVTFGGDAVSVVAEPHDAMVVIDTSASMRLHPDGRRKPNNLERAEDRLEELVGALPGGSTLGIYVAGQRGPKLAPRGDLGQVTAAFGRYADEGIVPAAVELEELVQGAASLFSSSGGDRKRVVYVITDATEGGHAALPEQAKGGAAVIAILARGDREDPPVSPVHFGVTQLEQKPALDLGRGAIRITGHVERFASMDDPAEETIDVRLSVDGQEQARTAVTLEGDVGGFEFTYVPPTSEGDATDRLRSARPASVSIVGRDDDAYPVDDERHVWLAAPAGRDVLLVNGDPSELRAHDEAYFLATALSAVDADGSIVLRSVVAEQLQTRVDELGPAALEEVDVLILANVSAPRPDVAELIKTRVEQGMGLWISVGDRVEPKLYNDRLGDVLPLRLRGSSFAGTLPGRTQARTESFAPAKRSHPIFSGLGGELGLDGARTRRLMLLEPDAFGTSQVALSYSVGAPALLTRAQGEGRVALLTTTIDRDWSDLPLRPGFVPLAERTVAWLSGTGAGLAQEVTTIGEPYSLPASDALSISTPVGGRVPATPTDGIVVFDDAIAPGHYRVHPSADPDALLSIFAAQVDPAEGNTVSIPMEETVDESGTATVRSSQPRWRLLIWVVLVGLIAETGLRLRARSKRQST